LVEDYTKLFVEHETILYIFNMMGKSFARDFYIYDSNANQPVPRDREVLEKETLERIKPLKTELSAFLLKVQTIKKEVNAQHVSPPPRASHPAL
jgi:hypothetical protein